MMKIMLMLRLAIVFFLMVTLSHISFASEKILRTRQLISQEEEQFFAEAKDLKNDPVLLMTFAQSDFLAKKINAQQFNQIILEQSNTLADQDQLSNNEKYMPQEGYIAQLFLPFKMWYYGYTKEEQKNIREKIVHLRQQKKVIQDQYDLVMLDDSLNELVDFESKTTERDILVRQYKIVLAILDKQIYQLQKRIGDVWGWFRK